MERVTLCLLERRLQPHPSRGLGPRHRLTPRSEASSYAVLPTPSFVPGISSEGSAVRYVALRYSEMRRILLCCIPNSVGDNLPPSRSSPGVSKLRAGATSPSPLGQRAAVRGREAEPLHLYKVPDCDHHFSGTTNGVILSKGFLWASGRTPAGRLDTNIIRGE